MTKTSLFVLTFYNFNDLQSPLFLTGYLVDQRPEQSDTAGASAAPEIPHAQMWSPLVRVTLSIHDPPFRYVDKEERYVSFLYKLIYKRSPCGDMTPFDLHLRVINGPCWVRLSLTYHHHKANVWLSAIGLPI